MLTVGIAVDDWKLPVFRRKLTESNYDYTDGGELSPGTTLLRVKCNDAEPLADLVIECQTLCRHMKPKGNHYEI